MTNDNNCCGEDNTNQEASAPEPEQTALVSAVFYGGKGPKPTKKELKKLLKDIPNDAEIDLELNAAGGLSIFFFPNPPWKITATWVRPINKVQ